MDTRHGGVLKTRSRVEMQVGDASGDMTWLVDSMVKTLRDTTRLATSAGRMVAEDLLTEMPTLSEGVRRCPSGTDVEVPWSPKGPRQPLWTVRRAYLRLTHGFSCEAMSQ